MFKKSVAFFIVIAFIFSGCVKPKLSIKETMEAISKASLETKAMNVDFEHTLNLDIQGKDMPKNLDVFTGMMKNLKVTGNYQMEGFFDAPKASGQYTTDFNGMSMKFEFYVDNQLFAFKYPVIGKFITANYEDLFGIIKESGSSDAEIEKIIALVKELYVHALPKLSKSLSEHINDEKIILEPDYTFTINGEEKKSDALVITFTLAELKNLYYNVIKDMVQDQEIYDIIAKYEFPTFPKTYEAYAKEFETLFDKKAYDTFWAEFEKIVSELSYKVVVGYDKNYKVNFQEMTANVKFEINESSRTEFSYDIHSTSAFSYDNITIVKPELTPDNSINIKDLNTLEP